MVFFQKRQYVLSLDQCGDYYIDRCCVLVSYLESREFNSLWGCESANTSWTESFVLKGIAKC